MMVFIAGCLARKMYSEKREIAAATSIQKYVRRWLLRRAYTKLSLAAIVIQSNIRCFSTRERFMRRKKHKAATLIQVSTIWTCAGVISLSPFFFSLDIQEGRKSPVSVFILIMVFPVKWKVWLIDVNTCFTHLQ